MLTTKPQYRFIDPTPYAAIKHAPKNHHASEILDARSLGEKKHRSWFLGHGDMIQRLPSRTNTHVYKLKPPITRLTRSEPQCNEQRFRPICTSFIFSKLRRSTPSQLRGKSLTIIFSSFHKGSPPPQLTTHQEQNDYISLCPLLFCTTAFFLAQFKVVTFLLEMFYMLWLFAIRQ